MDVRNTVGNVWMADCIITCEKLDISFVISAWSVQKQCICEEVGDNKAFEHYELPHFTSSSLVSLVRIFKYTVYFTIWTVWTRITAPA